MHKIDTITEANRFLAEIEESDTLITKSVKTLVINEKPVFFILVADKKNFNYYKPKY